MFCHCKSCLQTYPSRCFLLQAFANRIIKASTYKGIDIARTAGVTVKVKDVNANITISVFVKGK